jgi:hypothetical protein
MEKSKDVMSPLAQRHYGFSVEQLPDHSPLHGSPIAEALEENTRSAIPDQVSFRLDFGAWRLTRTERDRGIMDALMLGERTGEVSRQFGLSPGRVSQLRREFYDDWCRFCADSAETFINTV